MNKVTVKINGIEYNLKGNEKEEYLHKVAGYVDKKLKNIMNSNKMLSTSSAAVLTAVNAVDDLFKCDIAYSELLSKLENMEKTEKALMDQVESLKKQLHHLESYNEELANKIKHSANAEEIKEKSDKINSLTKEMEVMQESSRNYISDNNKMKTEVKELKFQLQSAKYKIIDLQNRLLESQMSLAKEKKFNNPLLKSEN